MTPELKAECEAFIEEMRAHPIMTQRKFERASELQRKIFAEHCTWCFDQHVKELEDEIQ